MVILQLRMARKETSYGLSYRCRTRLSLIPYVAFALLQRVAPGGHLLVGFAHGRVYQGIVADYRALCLLYGLLWLWPHRWSD